MFAVADLPAVLRLFQSARRGPFTISAYEFFTQRCLDRVLRHRKLRPPFAQAAECYVLLEVEAPHREPLEAWLSGVFENGLASDGVLAQHSGEAADLWSLREGISESLSATGLPHKNDVALPIAELESFTRALDHVFVARYPGWEIALFGHVGDGNLHINVMKPDALSKNDFLRLTKEADRDLFDLVRAHRGSISAEHGIGLLKKDFLGYSRTPEEIEIMRSVKRALDPNGILNPGKVFDM
jgi:FAD/FMN-containing dehydrogenase